MKDRIEIKGGATRYYLGTREVTEGEYRAVYPLPSMDGQVYQPNRFSGWPILSDALGVHPLDVAQAEADAKAKGVQTEFLADGRAVLTDRAHRKKYLKAYGFHDRKGGYGD